MKEKKIKWLMFNENYIIIMNQWNFMRVIVWQYCIFLMAPVYLVRCSSRFLRIFSPSYSEQPNNKQQAKERISERSRNGMVIRSLTFLFYLLLIDLWIVSTIHNSFLVSSIVIFSSNCVISKDTKPVCYFYLIVKHESNNKICLD